MVRLGTGLSLDDEGVLSVTSSSGEVVGRFVFREVPSGSLDGINLTFVIANSVMSGSETVFLNGLLLNKGSTKDYTMTSQTITLGFAPYAGDVLLVNYIKT